jgi:opacity protein-like surface antigen
MNYPSFVVRGELRVLNFSGRTGPKTVQIVPIQPNGTATINVPKNTYDLFGTHRSLTSVYGVDYQPTEFLTYSASVELGRIDDPLGDFDRTALSLGLRYQDEAGLSAKARLEFRRDEGILSGSVRDGDTVAFTSTARYEIDAESRLLFSFEGTHTETDGSSLPDGEFAEFSLGYAYRPIDNDKLNTLFKYTYLHDLYGQEIDGFNEPGPRQKSHVLSLDASYDLNRHLTLGGKIGGRFSESSPNSTAAFQENDAWLVVANARYHVTHKWDLLLEGRYLKAQQAGVAEFGVLGAAYRHVGNNFKVGVGYNFGKFSDDLTDLTFDDRGLATF